MKKFVIKNNRYWLWVFFLIYPLGSFFYAVKNFKIKQYRIIIVLFFGFYGLTFLPIPNSDGSRYKEDFEAYKVYSFSEYSSDIQDVFDGKSTNPDFYASTLKFVAHSFSSSSKFYFFLAALVYFFVLLKLLETIWENTVKGSATHIISFFIGCCFIYNIAAGINSIRFPLAFLVFSYGALNYVISREKKFIVVAFLSILIHFSFSISFGFLVVYAFLNIKYNVWILYILLLLALFFSSVFPSFLEQNLALFGNTTLDKYNAYTQEGFVETREDHLEVWNWYVYFNFYATYLFTFGAIFLTRLRAFKVTFDSTANNIYFFTLLMLINALLSGSVVDVISNRFNLLFSLFALIYLFYISKLNYKNILLRYLNYIYIPILIINILVKLRSDLYTVNSLVVFGNFISSFFLDVTISIQDLLTGK
jgi:hypothetical protein